MATIVFPIHGQHKGFPTGRSLPNTSRDLNNVRPMWDGKLLGGQRPGLDKWGAGTQIGAAEQPVVAVCVVASVS